MRLGRKTSSKVGSIILIDIDWLVGYPHQPNERCLP
jgi:hypothetical protein